MLNRDIINVNDILKKLFSEVPTDLQRIEVKKIKEYMKELDIVDDNSPFDNDKEFADFLLDTRTRGTEIKDLLDKCFKDINLDFEESELKKLNKQKCKEVFFKVFKVYPEVNPQVQVETEEKQEQIQKEIVQSNDSENERQDVNNKTTDTKQTEKVIFDLSKITKKDIEQIYKNGKICESDQIDIDEFELTENTAITLQDDFCIYPTDIELYKGCVGLLQNNTDKVVAIGYLENKKDEENNKDELHLIFDRKNIDYKSFVDNRLYKVICFPEAQNDFFEQNFAPDKYQGDVYVIETAIDYKSLETVNNTLCIDFGTSNTTVGSYGIFKPKGTDVEIVKFLDVTADEPIEREMLPTVVYIDLCKDVNNIVYSFGYEAKKKIIDRDYITKATVFHEIKRWINELDEKEEIHDEFGNKQEVARRDILKAYISHVISLAEQYFKVHFTRLHFSAPVKLKKSFIKKMKEIFDEYTVFNAGASLDEGVAIVYNHISDAIKDSIPEGPENEEKIMILDCGGGTTDLASCSFYCDTEGIAKNVYITTGFENGDSNFGGNNITFRILQMLKIKVANYLRNSEDIRVEDLINMDENEILQQIDENINTDIIYKQFNEAYKDAENKIPTLFAKCKRKKQSHQIKRNYYYLWQMAEAIKIEFYKENLVTVDFNKDEDRKIYAKNAEQYYLFQMNDDGNMTIYANPMKDIEITINEIRRLLYPDVYALLKTLLDNGKSANSSENYSDYDYYKLSGQSCKITLFHELLKEFIPGKRIRYKGKKQDDSSTLKMACISGCIKYMADKEFGAIKPKITFKMPKLIYKVYREIDNSLDLALDSDTITILKSPTSVRKVKFVIKDMNDKICRTLIYNIESPAKESARCTLSGLLAKISQKADLEELTIKEQIIDELGDIDLEVENQGKAMLCTFIVPSVNGYGINIFQICVANNAGNKNYYLSDDGKFESFDDEALETFFDGRR